MAHIVSCMLDAEDDNFSRVLNNYLAQATTTVPQVSNESPEQAKPSTEEQPFIWRMHQPERKYQLFPREAQSASLSPAKPLDPEQAYALAMGQTGDKTEKSTTASSLRSRLKDHSINRRRKVSVPDLGPMTTVQEVTMDSPTLPGYGPARSPLHERSISAPGQSWQHPHPQPPSFLDEKIELDMLINESFDSPIVRHPFTPMPANLPTPQSAATSVRTASTLPTPTSAPVETRSSPKPWERTTNYALVMVPKATRSEASLTPRGMDPLQPRSASAASHRANPSDTGSIMERGRPRKRSEATGGYVPKRADEPHRGKSAERRAFEQLPKGWKAGEAATSMGPAELLSVQKQALQQAAKFEVLRKEDVDKLSRELRQLDERMDYLRRTYASLRAGRRNLHTRICQYLRSPRTAKFSHDSMLKQEEALAELDASIDDWVMKLEKAENRRTRVRQKLLEHVAAAATLPIATGDMSAGGENLQAAVDGARTLTTPPRSPTKAQPTSALSSSFSPSPQSNATQLPCTASEQSLFEGTETVGLGLTASSIKSGAARAATPDPSDSHCRAETICIYADNDVYALLADVENEFNQLGSGTAEFSPTKEAPAISRAAHRDLRRVQSNELLNPKRLTGSSSYSSFSSRGSATSVDERSNTGCSSSSAAGSPILSSSPTVDKSAEVFLTNAVFRP